MSTNSFYDLEQLVQDEDLIDCVEDVTCETGVHVGFVGDTGVIYTMEGTAEDPSYNVLAQYNNGTLESPTPMNTQEIKEQLAGEVDIELTEEFIQEARERDFNDSKDYLYKQ